MKGKLMLDYQKEWVQGNFELWCKLWCIFSFLFFQYQARF